jgi:hypothetical protein
LSLWATFWFEKLEILVMPIDIFDWYGKTWCSSFMSTFFFLFLKTLLISLIGMPRHGVPAPCQPLSFVSQNSIGIFDYNGKT